MTENGAQDTVTVPRTLLINLVMIAAGSECLCSWQTRHGVPFDPSRCRRCSSIPQAEEALANV